MLSITSAAPSSRDTYTLAKEYGSTTSAPPGKRSRNDGLSETGSDSLTRDNIPTIVQAVLDALPTGAIRGTDSTMESSNQDAAVTNDSSPDNQDIE